MRLLLPLSLLLALQPALAQQAPSTERERQATEEARRALEEARREEARREPRLYREPYRGEPGRLDLPGHRQRSSELETRSAEHARAEALEREGKGAEAVEAYKRAARAGNAKAAKRLSEIYGKGIEGVAPDKNESLRWRNAARALGDMEEARKPEMSPQEDPSQRYYHKKPYRIPDSNARRIESEDVPIRKLP